MTDEEHAARIRKQASVLCVMMNEAAADGLHLLLQIKAYMHSSMKPELGNLPSDFKPTVYVRRERHI